jgi:hypothetical protein
MVSAIQRLKWIFAPLLVFVLFQNCTQSMVPASIVTAQSSSVVQKPANFSAKGILYNTTNTTSGPQQYQVNWNPRNIYSNNSGQAMVISSLDIAYHARPGVNLAYADVCITILKNGDNGTTDGTSSGVEQLCFSEYKTPLANDWDHASVHIDLPGQGLWFPSDTYLVCGSQGYSDASQNPPAELADITCAATIAYADKANPLAPVQALRTPYIDQRFTANYSALTPHTNTSSVARAVLGVWNYMSTPVTSPVTMTNCLGTALNSQTNWQQQCTSYSSQSTPNPEPLQMLNPGFAFEPGDQIAAQCTLQAGNNSNGSICASYFFVVVPVVNGAFQPLGTSETIRSADAQAFCSHNPQYALTNGASEQTCLQTLAH